MDTAKKFGNCKDKATSPKKIPEQNCVSTTKNFLVLNISRNGLHNGLIVHGNIITEVQKAIWASEIPSPLNIKAVTMFNTTKGIPMAK